MKTMAEFFHMGGYAFYVWMSYIISAVVLTANLALPLVRRERLLADLRRRENARRQA